MVVGKLITKVIQSLPTWEVTKYYGRVCIFQLRCIKYRIQTSEAWFNFKCKFMPGSLRNEIEGEEVPEEKSKQEKDKHRRKLLLRNSYKNEIEDSKYQNEDWNDRSTSMENTNDTCSDEDYTIQRSTRKMMARTHKHGHVYNEGDYARQQNEEKCQKQIKRYK